MNENQTSKCKLIAEYYGKQKQTMQAVQELSELIVVLTARPDQRGDDYGARLIDEVADCRIMLQQIAMLYDCNDIDAAIDAKLDRQLRRIGGAVNVDD